MKKQKEINIYEIEKGLFSACAGKHYNKNIQRERDFYLSLYKDI